MLRRWCGRLDFGASMSWRSRTAIPITSAARHRSSSEFRPREVSEGIPVPRSGALTALGCKPGRRREVGQRLRQRPPLPGRSRGSSRAIRRSADWERQKVRNDDSIVLELRWRDVSILLTGDIGTGAGAPPSVRRLPPARDPGRQDSAPRQPARRAGSTSCGAHPIPRSPSSAPAAAATTSVTPSPRSSSATGPREQEVLRTDRDGAVTIDTDGATVDVRTFTGRKFSVK